MVSVWPVMNDEARSDGDWEAAAFRREQRLEKWAVTSAPHSQWSLSVVGKKKVFCLKESRAFY